MSRDLYCNTIIHLLFHYFLLHRSLLHFKINNIFKILVCLVFCCSTASYSETCGGSIRVSHMTVVLE